MQLRDYQERFVFDIREAFKRHRRVLGVSPTGSGKTECFSYIAKGVANNGKRIVTTVHRREILFQISRAMDRWGVNHALLTADSRGMPRAPCIVASVFTLANRMLHCPEPDLIIIDEAHHSAQGTTWKKVIDHFPKARILGLTATPCRLDMKGLGDAFDFMVEGPTVAELTALGWLSPAEYYASKETLDLRSIKVRGGDYVTSELAAAMDKPSITGSAVEHYARLCNGKRALVFCCSIKHSEDVAAEFRQAGFAAESIDGKLQDYERDAILQRFARGDTRVLANCALVSEGFDLSTIEVAILLRPTKSLALYLQMCGRAIRPMEGKTKTIILDHASNIKTHGFIDEIRQWSLDGAVEKQDRARAAPISVCPKCYAVHSPAPTCPRCGHIYVRNGRMVDEVDGELERISGPEDIAEALRETEYAKSYNILLNVAKQRSMERAHDWAFANVAAKYARDLARAGDRRPEGYMINGLSLEERDRLMQMIRGTKNQIEMVV
jgi:DNA repair protein RadD